MTTDNKQHHYWEQDHGHRQYDHPIVDFFAQQRVSYIRSWLDLDTIETALDVGCGNGFSTYHMQQFVPYVWGLDYSDYMLAQHPHKQNGRLAIADGLQLPFADNRFDLVYGWEVLHHISDPNTVVAEMVRVSGRYVLLVEPNRNNPAQFAFALADPEHRWVLRYSLAYMRQLLLSSNLQVVYAGCGGWLFPNVTPIWLLPFIQKLP
jgi:ubiquinone/menaquinone biosynthesis C-methylase UbiE